MKGVRSYDARAFHPDCVGVTVVDVAGFPHLWCPACRVYANLEAVSGKHEDYNQAKLERSKADEYIVAKHKEVTGG